MKKYKDLLFFTITMFFTVILELALDALKVREENIYLVFVLSILVIIIESRSIVYGLLASIVTVLSFDFFVTEPRFTLNVSDPNNYVSFFMFVIVSFIVNSLVLQLQNQIRLSKENERKVNILYNISADILHSHSQREIFENMVDDIFEQIRGDVSIISSDGTIYGKQIDTEQYDEAIAYALRYNTIIDSSSVLFSGLSATIFPIHSPSDSYGVVLVGSDPILKEEEKIFIRNIIEEMVIALDKDHISLMQEETKLLVEREKFKSSLLKGLSHDLKTPLTMIQSGSEFLCESFDNITDQSKKELIRDIYNESCSLSGFVNNLLDMTRLENSDMKLKRTLESADDIIFQVLEKQKRRIGDTKIEVKQSDEVVMVYADVELLSQVFVNLIDNAITHTRKGTSVTISYFKEEDDVCFKVADNGGGISEEKLDLIFEDFYSLAANNDRKRSHGLGLSICKAIVEAHGGKIHAENNDMGGTTFVFTVKNKEE